MRKKGNIRRKEGRKKVRSGESFLSKEGDKKG